MNDKREPSLSERQMEFFGAITASVTHEINNVFAIINEHSGLLSDWLEGSKKGRPLDPEKIERINDTISRQIRRGRNIVKTLNRFAHSADVPEKEIDLNETMGNLVELLQRFAQKTRSRLATAFPPQPVRIETNPFALQQAVFACVAAFLAESGPEDSVTIEVHKEADGATLSVAGPPLGSDKIPPVLELLMDNLKGRMRIESGGGEIRLSLPRTLGS